MLGTVTRLFRAAWYAEVYRLLLAFDLEYEHCRADAGGRISSRTRAPLEEWPCPECVESWRSAWRLA